MIGFGVLLFASVLYGLSGVDIAGLILGIPLTVALLAFFFLRFARRRLDVLGNADQLEAFLTKLDASESPTSTEQVIIPTDVFQQMWGIEDVHIQRRRSRAIDESHDSGHVSAILKSRAIIADTEEPDTPATDGAQAS